MMMSHSFVSILCDKIQSPQTNSKLNAFLERSIFQGALFSDSNFQSKKLYWNIWITVLFNQIMFHCNLEIGADFTTLHLHFFFPYVLLQLMDLRDQLLQRWPRISFTFHFFALLICKRLFLEKYFNIISEWSKNRIYFKKKPLTSIWRPESIFFWMSLNFFL